MAQNYLSGRLDFWLGICETSANPEKLEYHEDGTDQKRNLAAFTKTSS